MCVCVREGGCCPTFQLQGSVASQCDIHNLSGPAVGARSVLLRRRQRVVVQRTNTQTTGRRTT